MGMIILAAVLILMAVFFWKTVSQQAAMVKEEEAAEEASAIPAIYMYYGDTFKTGVFVNMGSKEIFRAEIPKEGLYNKKGTLIPGDILEEGDMVRIYGDNVIEAAAEGELPVYKGVTRMQRSGRATLEEADVYRQIVKEEQDPEGRK